MKLSYVIAAAVAVASVSVSTPAFAEKPIELSPTELGALQSQRYSVPGKIAFNAVLATLQSFGYTDVNASRDAGTITAQTEAKAKTIYNIFWGFGKKKYTQKASLLIEEVGDGSLVRLNLHLNEAKARGIFGTSFSDGKLIRYAGPYQDFFRALDTEIVNRGGSVGTTAAIAKADGINPVELGNGIKLVPAKTPSGYCIQAPAGYVGTGSASAPAVSSERPLCS